MKKLILLFLLLATVIPYAQAKKEKLRAYRIQENGGQGSYACQFWIDREAMKFYFDSDSEDEANMLIKNYKKTGDKETFDVYPEVDPSVKHCAITLDMEAGKNGTIALKYDFGTQTYMIEAASDEQSASAADDKKSAVVAPENKPVDNKPVENESGVKKVLNKGLGVFKKKGK